MKVNPWQSRRRLRCSLFSVTLLAITLSGCGTIRFTHDLSDERQTTEGKSQWHHGTLDGMIEVSQPKNLYRTCRGKPWQEVKVQYSVYNGITALTLAAGVGAVVPVLDAVSLWTPWTVTTVCAE